LFLLLHAYWAKTDFENRHFHNFQTSVTLTLTLDHHISLSTYTPNFVEIGKTLTGQVGGQRLRLALLS